MARGLQNFPNITHADGDFPNGRVKDNPGDNTGTPVNEYTLGDIWQFFAKLMREASLTPNGLPESEYSGQQYYQALRIASQRYRSYVAVITQTSTSAPVTSAIIDNTLGGTIAWSRNSAGDYTGTLGGAFLAGKTVLIAPGFSDVSTMGFISFVNSNINQVSLRTYNTSFVAADGVLNTTTIEVRVYY